MRLDTLPKSWSSEARGSISWRYSFNLHIRSLAPRKSIDWSLLTVRAIALRDIAGSRSKRDILVKTARLGRTPFRDQF